MLVVLGNMLSTDFQPVKQSEAGPNNLPCLPCPAIWRLVQQKNMTLGGMSEPRSPTGQFASDLRPDPRPFPVLSSHAGSRASSGKKSVLSSADLPISSFPAPKRKLGHHKDAATRVLRKWMGQTSRPMYVRPFNLKSQAWQILQNDFQSLKNATQKPHVSSGNPYKTT